MTISLIEKRRILEHVHLIAQELINKTRSRTISIKLRTLLRYAYVSYRSKTTDLNVIRGLVPRIRLPSKFSNQYFYREIERSLRSRFNINIEVRRQLRYVTFYKSK
ncbi:MAG: hypothetical protein DRJ41_03960 [Thermoprotei archaeon]|nr:MAG: hypothetical protein DRJ41_03960 [Thermoprotei archaeon]